MSGKDKPPEGNRAGKGQDMKTEGPQRSGLTLNLPELAHTTAQVTVESVPVDAAEGKDVLLRIHNLPGILLGYDWFREEILSYHIETAYSNGSLLFQNITLNDMGYYTLQVIKKKFQIEQLHKPSITSNNSSPMENADSVVLTCEPQTQSTSCLWSVNSKSLPDSPRLELSLDNRTLTVHGCETRNPVSADCSDPFTLNVLYGPDTPTISPSDSYYHLGGNLSVSCCTASKPPAQYSWLISGRPQPSTQELIIPNITNGTCVNKTTVKIVTQVDQPCLQARNTIVIEPNNSVVLISANDTGVSIQCFFNGQSLKLIERMKLSQDKCTLAICPVRREDAGNCKCEVSKVVTSRKTDPLNERSTMGLPVGSFIGIAFGVLLRLVFMATVGCLLLCRRTGRVSACHDLKEVWCPASTPRDHGPASSSISPDSLPSPTAAVLIYQRPLLVLQEFRQLDTSIYCQINHKAEVAS
ncbi:unnamed protein product [Nyctereutes procyonoides]|uniref:(raccoon dog) hypothetical protein n=1 Tax=Nyctereutes procyonoides TaxID=34880 RepID=A0A811ZTV2_NYCPR|nr:unnamed protein product [Nyctereutes procyonoides]